MKDYTLEPRWIARRELLHSRSRTAVKLLLSSLVHLDHMTIEEVHARVIQILLREDAQLDPSL